MEASKEKNQGEQLDEQKAKGGESIEKSPDQEISSQDEDSGDSDEEVVDENYIISMSELMNMRFNVNKVKTVMKGPMCWKCYAWGIFFTCGTCGRHFHRECAFMGPCFPLPIFDKSTEDACKAEWGQVKLLKCVNCILSEETRIPKMLGVTNEDLNKALFLLVSLVRKEYGGDVLEKFPTVPNAMSIDKILEKAAANEYKSVEGCYGDFKMIVYNTFSKYSKESEAGEVATTVTASMSFALRIMISCIECALRRFNKEGKLLNSKEYFSVNMLPCEEPHSLIWCKDGNFPYWPVKLLAIDFTNNGEKELIVQYFGEKACPRIYTPTQSDVKIRTYSTTYPGKQPTKWENKSWHSALSNCKKYVEKLRTRFGKEGVVIPEKSEEFTWDFDTYTYMIKMFPTYGKTKQL